MEFHSISFIHLHSIGRVLSPRCSFNTLAAYFFKASVAAVFHASRASLSFWAVPGQAFVKTTVFAGWAILHNKALGSAIFPPAAFLLAVKVVLGTHPADGKAVQTSFQHFEARLKQHFTRLEQRADTVLMMHGEAFELDLLQKALRDLSTITRKLYGLMFPVEMTEWLFLHSTQAASLLELVAFAFAAVGSRSLKSGDSFDCRARVVGQHLLHVQNFFTVCSAWNAFLSSRTLLMSMAPATSRVKQLYARLDALEVHGHHGHHGNHGNHGHHGHHGSKTPKAREISDVSPFQTHQLHQVTQRTTKSVKSRWRSAPARLWATLQLGLLTSGRRKSILQKARRCCI
eukprot:Skav213531  [mRNA]  locus=scaffold1184:56286:57317:- [translate_table: standard]